MYPRTPAEEVDAYIHRASLPHTTVLVHTWKKLIPSVTASTAMKSPKMTSSCLEHNSSSSSRIVLKRGAESYNAWLGNGLLPEADASLPEEKGGVAGMETHSAAPRLFT